jgi:hypothetical protein
LVDDPTIPVNSQATSGSLHNRNVTVRQSFAKIKRYFLRRTARGALGFELTGADGRRGLGQALGSRQDVMSRFGREADFGGLL